MPFWPVSGHRLELAALEAEDLLRAARPALVVALERALGAVELAVEQEVELDEQRVAVLVDELDGEPRRRRGGGRTGRR